MVPRRNKEIKSPPGTAPGQAGTTASVSRAECTAVAPARSRSDVTANPDHLAPLVEQWPAGISLIERGVGLNHVARQQALVLVLPQGSRTFDHHRKTTSWDHLLADFVAATPETDRTHIADALELTDTRHWTFNEWPGWRSCRRISSGPCRPRACRRRAC